jgi:DNA (cytosine-5)-methyltransferase 1
MSNLTVTDLFAGAGGSSTGMIQVPGVHVRYAANHWAPAVAIHNANHPHTHHAAVDLHEEDPRYFARTDILWASPECTKWSQANGSNLPAIEEGLFEDPESSDVAMRSRLLMFDVLRFIEHHRYRAVIVENVVDIATQEKYRMAWYEWRKRLRALGYAFRVVSLNSMHAQLLGDPAPQSRDRIYIVAWPEGERAPDLDRVTRTPAWCPRCDRLVEAAQSWKNRKDVGRYKQAYVFTDPACGTVVEPAWLPAAAAIDWSLPGERVGDRLAEKTRLRIAMGIARYWGPMHVEASGNQYDAADPKHPQHGDPSAYYRAWPVDEPLKTLHTRESKALVVPSGGTWNEDARPVTDPHRTLMTRDAYGFACVPLLDKNFGTGVAYPTTNPAATFTAGGNHHALVTSYYGNSTGAHPVDDPLGTLTTRDRHALIMRNNTARGDQGQMTTPVHEQLRTLTTAGHQSLLGAPDQLDLGLHTAPRRRRPTTAEIRTAEDMVPEVLYRMLRPHEVAAGMAFPADYDWHPDKTKPTNNRDLVKAAGNAVTPPAARDLMAAVVASITGEDPAA